MRVTVYVFRVVSALIFGVSSAMAADATDESTLIFSYSRVHSLQAQQSTIPDIRLFSNRTIIANRPRGYLNPGEHRFRISEQTYTTLLQMLSGTLGSDQLSNNQAEALSLSANLDSLSLDSQPIVIRSDPTVSSITLSAGAQTLGSLPTLPVQTPSVGAQSTQFFLPLANPNIPTANELTPNVTTSISENLQQRLMELYRDLNDSSLPNEERQP